MHRSSEQKMKILILYDILQKRTDEEHQMSTSEIQQALKEKGFEVSRQTLYEDIDSLNRFGYEVICSRGRVNRYFVGERAFERPEVQVLLSAVSASNFLSEKKMNALITKISELLGKTQAEQIKEALCIGGKIKYSNEMIYYSIDAIIRAISTGKKLSYTYFDYDANGRKQYRKNGERYVVNPVGIVCSEDNIYLVCYHDKYGNPANYRIDRMDNVQVSKSRIVPNKDFENFDLNKYKTEQFSMFSGEKTVVRLIFPSDLMEIAIDRFGENVRPISSGSGEYIIETTVMVSRTFFACLTTFEGRVKIQHPDNVRERYREFVSKLFDSIN